MVTTVSLNNGTSMQQVVIDVRCMYDKTATIFNHQISYSADNIKYGLFPKNTLKVIGWGNFASMIQLKQYSDDTFADLHNSTTAIRFDPTL